MAGLGTRILAVTKAIPKEMLTIVDKSQIHYAMEEAKAAGIEQFYFVTGRAISAIEDHFGWWYSFKLYHHPISTWPSSSRRRCATAAKAKLLDELREWLPAAGQLAYTRQQLPLGL